MPELGTDALLWLRGRRNSPDADRGPERRGRLEENQRGLRLGSDTFWPNRAMGRI